jgi:CheY-like chemotaxis protein
MSNDEKRPLGKILLQRKLVSQQDLDEALRAQKRAPGEATKPLASQLTEQGAIDELEALRALSEQHGVPGIDLTQVALLLEHLDVVPREVSETHLILPVLMRGDRIFLAMADPSDKRVVDELEFVTGKKVYPYIALSATITRTIAAAYDAKARGEPYFLGARVPAETLRQLGIAAPPQAPDTAPPAPAPPTEKAIPAATRAQPPRPPPLNKPPPPGARAQGAPPPLPPRREPPLSEPPVVVDDAMEVAQERAEVSTSEFGNLAADISSVAALPDDMRVRAGQAAAAITPGTGKLVLVVDDEEDIRRLLKRLLADRGYRVLEADRGLLALRLVKEHMPDLIILDAMLPELHGFDIARRIKGSEKYGHIPIVMISAVYRGWRIAEDLKQSYGIEEYLEKPFRIADVVAAVNRAFAAKGGAAEAAPAAPGHAAAAPPPPGAKQMGSTRPPRDVEALSADAEKALADGIAAYKANQVERAIEHLKRGVGIDPLSYRLHFHLALLYGKKGMVYEGIQELEKAVELNPKHFPALKNLAVLYEKAGFKHKAVEMWERCVHAAPDAQTRDSIKAHLVQLL